MDNIKSLENLTKDKENFYNELSLKFSNNINNYFVNKNKISHLINDMKKFNLDKKNLLTVISGILKNEA